MRRIPSRSRDVATYSLRPFTTHRSPSCRIHPVQWEPSIRPVRPQPEVPPISQILVVDSDPSAAEEVRRSMELVGHEVRVASSASEALARLQECVPDLVILELRLPDLSGLGLCKILREEVSLRDVPILMLSAAEEMDRLIAFELGVDDFVSKPFSARELAVRASAILRRTSRSAAREPEGNGALQYERLTLDLGQQCAYVDGERVELTEKEFDVLSLMARNAGRVLSRERILADVWGSTGARTPRVVDTQVKWIRRKLGKAGHYLETLRGVGYRLRDPAD